MKDRNYTRSLPIPKDGRRGCLCKETETYSRKCCGKDYYSQGVGNVVSTHATPYQGYRIQGCSDSHEHNVHYHGTLTVGSVYYIELENGHTGCHTVLEERPSEGIHINSAVLYGDCSECIAAN